MEYPMLQLAKLLHLNNKHLIFYERYVDLRLHILS